MGILSILSSVFGFVMRPAKFGGGGPIIIWLLAAYGGYSLIMDSFDFTTRMLGVNKDQIIAQQEATIELYGKTNADLQKTVETAIKTQENADKAISEAYDEVTKINKDLETIKDTTDKQLEELGVVVPLVSYHVDIEETVNEDGTVEKKETIHVDDGKEPEPEIAIVKATPPEPEPVKVEATPEAIEVKATAGSPTQLSVRKKKKRVRHRKASEPVYVIKKSQSVAVATINIRALWDAYTVAMRTAEVNRNEKPVQTDSAIVISVSTKRMPAS